MTFRLSLQDKRELVAMITESLSTLRSSAEPVTQSSYIYTAEEKAKQVGLSVSRLRRVKDDYEYIKDPHRRRLMFK